MLRFAILLAATLSAQTLPAPYRQYCASCHGDSATGTDRGPNLIDTRSLRPSSEAKIRMVIEKGTSGGMPAFANLKPSDLDLLAKTVRMWNASAFDAQPSGDFEEGKKLFESKCLSCHMVQGNGGSNGPDLSSIGRELTVREIEAQLRDPNTRRGKRNSASCPSWAFCPDNPWAVVTVKLPDGTSLKGFARSRGRHDIQLQTFDGIIHLIQNPASIVDQATSHMPQSPSEPASSRSLAGWVESLLENWPHPRLPPQHEKSIRCSTPSLATGLDTTAYPVQIVTAH